jgi:flagellar assembly protein FliH
VLIGTRLPASLTVEADPSVERGGLRIETTDGGIEDGPSHWRRALAEAFGQC